MTALYYSACKIVFLELPVALCDLLSVIDSTRLESTRLDSIRPQLLLLLLSVQLLQVQMRTSHINHACQIWRDAHVLREVPLSVPREFKTGPLFLNACS